MDLDQIWWIGGPWDRGDLAKFSRLRSRSKVIADGVKLVDHKGVFPLNAWMDFDRNLVDGWPLQQGQPD